MSLTCLQWNMNGYVNNYIDLQLLIKEHIIEISGDSEACGKTWIAKKIFDCINHPKDYKKRY